MCSPERLLDIDDEQQAESQCRLQSLVCSPIHPKHLLQLRHIVLIGITKT